ncbi:MAG TPA: helix-turn-helix domain-containing protein [Mycobacteriales bacterium]|nr:helix-turn-helix domain-containing protein [Mycobacteriales bacterium]
MINPALLEGEVDLVGVSPAELARLASVAHLVRLRPGELLFRPGDSPKHLYWVVSGYLNGAYQGPRTSFVCAYGGRGEGSWGATSALLDHPRTHFVWGTDHTELLAVPGAEFELLLAEIPSLRRAQTTWLAGRLRTIGLIVGWHVDLDLPRRLCQVLLSSFSRDDYVDLPLRWEELASLVGASRQEQSAAVARLVRRGLFERTGGRSLRVLDRAAVERFARPATLPPAPLTDLGAGEPASPQELTSVPALRGVDATVVVRRRLPPGAVLGHRDAPVSEVHAVLDGTVALHTPTSIGGFRLTDARPRLDLLGVDGALSGTGWCTDVVTVSTSTVVSVPVSQLRSTLDEAGRQRALLAQVAAQQHRAFSSWTALRTVPVASRLVTLLLERSEPDGAVRLACTQQSLAAELGTSRKSVSAALGSLLHAGALSGSTRVGLRIVEPDLLRRVAGGPSAAPCRLSPT